MTFKVGDFVECVKNDECLTKGSVYRVLALDKDNDPRVENDRKNLAYYHLSSFKLSNTNKTKGENTMEKLKSFLEKNSDTFFTIGIIIILDHLFFDGAFREKIKDMIDKLINKTNKNLE